MVIVRVLELRRETRCYAAAHYAAGTWERTRRVIYRVLVSGKGTDVRFCVVSFTEAGAKYLYETVYCDRGRMEQMIKDHKTALNPTAPAAIARKPTSSDCFSIQRHMS